MSLIAFIFLFCISHGVIFRINRIYVYLQLFTLVQHRDSDCSTDNKPEIKIDKKKTFIVIREKVQYLFLSVVSVNENVASTFCLHLRLSLILLVELYATYATFAVCCKKLALHHKK